LERPGGKGISVLQHVLNAGLAQHQVHNRLTQPGEGGCRTQRRLALVVLRLCSARVCQTIDAVVRFEIGRVGFLSTMYLPELCCYLWATFPPAVW